MDVLLLQPSKTGVGYICNSVVVSLCYVDDVTLECHEYTVEQWSAIYRVSQNKGVRDGKKGCVTVQLIIHPYII